jgi:hypothetical protein
MIIKVINDSARPDGIILIFLVFNAYPRIIENLVLLLIITKKLKLPAKLLRKFNISILNNKL